MIGVGQIGRIGGAYAAIGGGPTLPLDTMTAAAAYSTRRLRSAFSGPALRVRRSSDNTEQDIAFTAAGLLDAAALAAFVGSNSGFVTTWYDQSGNARNATQTTAASQPRIVNAGTIDLHNGRPLVVFSGSQSLSGQAGSYLPSSASPLSLVVAHRQGSLGGSNCIFDIAQGASYSGTGTIRRFFSALVSQANRVYFAAGIRDTAWQAAILANTAYVQSFVLPSATFDGGVTNPLAWVNGVAQVVNSGGSGGPSTMSPDRIGIGANAHNSEFYVGGICELVYTAFALPTADRQTLERNQGAHFGITVA